MPARSAALICPAADSGVSRAARVAGSKRSRKKTTRVAPSRISAACPRLPGVICHQRCAASTNVRSSAAPLMKVNPRYGRGGVTVASTWPVAVARITTGSGMPATPLRVA